MQNPLYCYFGDHPITLEELPLLRVPGDQWWNTTSCCQDCYKNLNIPTLVMSLEDRIAMVEAFLCPPKPNEKAIQAARRYKDLIK